MILQPGSIAPSESVIEKARQAKAAAASKHYSVNSRVHHRRGPKVREAVIDAVFRHENAATLSTLSQASDEDLARYFLNLFEHTNCIEDCNRAVRQYSATGWKLADPTRRSQSGMPVTDDLRLRLQDQVLTQSMSMADADLEPTGTQFASEPSAMRRK